MGCFSFICKKSGEPVLSSSFSGDAVHLFLLKDGEVIEHMFGNYDSYGRVFNTKKPPKGTATDNGSFEWNLEWNRVCDLMFDKDRSNGIAAILDVVYNGTLPTTRSKSDPNQGWGKHGEYFASNTPRLGPKVKKPFHKVFKTLPPKEYKYYKTIDKDGKVGTSFRAPKDMPELDAEYKKLIKETQELEKKLGIKRDVPTTVEITKEEYDNFFKKKE